MTQTTPSDERDDELTHLAAQSTDVIDGAPSSPDESANPVPLGNISTSETFTNPKEENRTYQDDLDAGDDQTDPFIDEATDDPSDGFQIPRDEFKQEMDKIELSDLDDGNEDMRETIEDRDENDDNAASVA